MKLYSKRHPKSQAWLQLSEQKIEHVREPVVRHLVMPIIPWNQVESLDTFYKNPPMSYEEVLEKFGDIYSMEPRRVAADLVNVQPLKESPKDLFRAMGWIK